MPAKKDPVAAEVKEEKQKTAKEPEVKQSEKEPAKKTATKVKTEAKEVKKPAAKTKSSKVKNPNKLKKSDKKFSKKYREVVGLVDKTKLYELDEAVDVIQKTATTKFDSSVEIHIGLGLDPKLSDQNLRGSLVLPAGTGKDVKVAVVAGTEKEAEAKKAGADTVGGADLVEKISKGWLEFDVLVATPDMMSELGKLGKILGTRGLMPNPKTGTVTSEVGKAVENLKKGQVEYRLDKQSIIHQVVGKVSFKPEALRENIQAFLHEIANAKPASAKGSYFLGISLATTMGPGIRLDVGKTVSRRP